MRRRDQVRGSTIAECLFTLALCVTVVGACTLLYGNVVGATLDSAAMLDTGDGNGRIARELDFLIGSAIAAEVRTVGGRTVLKLTMPSQRGERNANGLYDAYNPSFLHPRIANAYLPGERVWIYSGLPNEAITPVGNVPLLARRADDATPTLNDIDWLWSYHDGIAKTRRRSPSATTLAFSISGGVVSYTITALQSDGASEAGFDRNDARTFREHRIEGSELLLQSKPQ